MGQPGNRPLADRITELGLTTVELAAALNDAIEDITGQPGRATDRYVRLLVAGRIRWPWPTQRQALEAVLGQPVAELGFVPRSTSRDAASSGPGAASPLPGVASPGPGPAGSSPGVASPGPGAGRSGPTTQDLDRREILGIAGGAPLSLTIPALPRRGRLGMSDVERQRRTLCQLIGIDDQLGGIALAGIAARQAQRLLGALEVYEKSDQIERSVYMLAGEYLAAAGWFAIDADELDVAGRYLDRALRAASIARDVMLQAQIWNGMAMRARQGGNFAEAYTIAKAGLASTAARRNPQVAALFHARVACGHAVRAEVGRAERSLSRAAEALDRVDGGPPPIWLRFFDQAQLSALAAMAYNLLGQHDKAEARAVEDLRLLSPGYQRNRVHGMLHLVEARLGRREVEQAASDAWAACELASGIRGGVRSGRVAIRLRRLRTLFGHWSDVPAAASWIEAYDTGLGSRSGQL